MAINMHRSLLPDGIIKVDSLLAYTKFTPQLGPWALLAQIQIEYL